MDRAFLFTDVEGSTKLLQRAGDDLYARILETHHQAIRRGASMHRAEEIGSEGDALFFVFDRAEDALAAACDAQLALTTAEWPENEAVRVRMGVHVGPASPTSTGWVGLGLHHVSRVTSAAHGGQVLVSDAAAAVAMASTLPPDVALRDVGRHRLKDLGAPQRLYQLVHPGLSESFAPLRTLDVRPNNLPLQLTSFVGRVEEIEEVRALLDAHRLVTLVGGGGGGKTRLALQLAADLVERYDDGVWFVELAPVSDPALVANAVATVLGVRQSEDRALDAALDDYLRDKKLLLLLDNCEHVIDVAAKLAERLVRTHPALSVVATSREPLGVTGEVVWRVPALAVPAASAGVEAVLESEAARLFVDRALAGSPSFTVGADDAVALADVCRHLEGIPLAIELAAARTRVLSVTQIAERLNDRFRLLAGGPRTTDARHQTLRAAVDWSHDLLTEPQRILVRRLGVFAGGFDLESAEAVCGRDALSAFDVLDLLSDLVDRSLVVKDEVDDRARFRLAETIRAYVLEKLEAAGEMEVIRERHAARYRLLAEEAQPHLDGPDVFAWLERLDRDEDNLRAALQWHAEQEEAPRRRLLVMVAALGAFWSARGRYDEGRAWAKAAAQGAQAVAVPTAWPRVELWAGRFALASGDNADAARHFDLAVELGRAANDDEVLALALAHRERTRGTPDATAMHAALEEAAPAAERAGSAEARVECLDLESTLAMLEHLDLETGRRSAMAAIEVARSSGSPRLLAQTLKGAASAASLLEGDALAAIAQLTEARTIADRLGDQALVARLLGVMGQLSIHAEEYELARRYLDEGLDIARSMGIPAQVEALESRLEEIALATEADPAAQRERGLARVADLRGKDRPMDLLMALIELGDIEVGAADVTGARATLEEARDLATGTGIALLRMVAASMLAGLALYTGDLEGADALSLETVAAAEQMGQPELLASAQTIRADLARERGDRAGWLAGRLPLIELWEGGELMVGTSELLFDAARDAATLGRAELSARLLGAALGRPGESASRLRGLHQRALEDRLQSELGEDALARERAVGAGLDKPALIDLVRRSLPEI